MLNDEVIDKVIERLVNRMESANLYILKEIARSIKEIGEINPSKAGQLVQMMKYGGDYNKILNKISKLTKLNKREIEEIFEEVAKNDYRFARQFYEYRNKEYIPYEYNRTLRTQVDALSKIAEEEYINLTRTSALGFGVKDKSGNIVFKGIKETYYDLLDEAVLSVSQGKETFNSVMYRQLKNIGESGLKVVYPTTYIDKNGIERHHTRRLDSAVRMNLKSALRNLHNEMQEEIGKEFDSDGVEISVHENPAQDHEDAQGKQFSNEEFNKLQTEGMATTYDNKVVNLHRHNKNGSTSNDFRPISEWNCYHYVFAIVLGVNNPQYSNKKLKEIKERNDKGFDYEGKHYSMYRGTQLQRRIETEIRKNKDLQIMGRESNNKQLIATAQKNIRNLTQKYNELNKISGLRPKLERMKVVGYERVKV